MSSIAGCTDNRNNAAPPVLELKSVTKYFRRRVRTAGAPFGHTAISKAVDDVSFRIGTREAVALVGESGCGKSTTARLILRLLDLTEGAIHLDGEDISGIKGRRLRRLRTKMQLVFQDPTLSLSPRMTVEQIVTEPMIGAGVTSSRQRRQKAKELLDLVGIAGGDMMRYPHEFSGGQRQRIGIARALILHPELVVLDEPVAALDVSIRSQVINLLGDLQDQLSMSYLFISHDLRLIRQLCTTTFVMYLGRIVESAPTEVLFRAPLHPYTQGLLSAVPVADPVAQRAKKRYMMHGEIPSPWEPPSGCRFRTRCPFANDCCAERLPQLIEVSPNHFVEDCWCVTSGASSGHVPAEHAGVP